MHRIHIEKADPYGYGYYRDGDRYSSKPVRLGHDAMRMPLLEKVRDQLSHSNAGTSPDGAGFVQSIDQRWNPTLHLLLRGGQRTPEACRTIASAAINGYPPAHMIPLDGRNKAWDPVARMKRATAVEGIRDFLHKKDETGKFELKDDDIVLVVDADDTWFQLPAQLTVHRFLERLYEDNLRLLAKHGRIYLKDGEQRAYSRRGEQGDEDKAKDNEKPKEASSSRETVQKYTERIIFAASKECNAPGKKLRAPACMAVPFSPLRPDTYDKDTDKNRDPMSYRPRWLSGGMVMGLVADMRLLYQKAADIANLNPWLDEEFILARIHGEQEYMRELDRRTTSSGFFSRLGERLGYVRQVNLNNLDIQIKPGERYEYGIGLDYNAKLFLPFIHNERDIAWLRFDDSKELLKIQRERKIPFSTELRLPPDISTLQSPFYSPDDKTIAWRIAAYNDRAVPAFPHPRIRSWPSFPLLTNIPTFSIPPIFHMDITIPESERKKYWEKMWFTLWTRPLLAESVRRHKEDVAGGEWDKRNGKGGVWNFKEEWVSWMDFCKPWEAKVFGDKHGEWGVEVDVGRS